MEKTQVFVAYPAIFFGRRYFVESEFEIFSKEKVSTQKILPLLKYINSSQLKCGLDGNYEAFFYNRIAWKLAQQPICISTHKTIFRRDEVRVPGR